MEENLKKLQEKKAMLKQQIEQIEAMDVDSVDMNLEHKIKSEQEDVEMESLEEGTKSKKHPMTEKELDDAAIESPAKVWKGIRYKSWNVGVLQPSKKFKKQSDREITEV